MTEHSQHLAASAAASASVQAETVASPQATTAAVVSGDETTLADRVKVIEGKLGGEFSRRPDGDLVTVAITCANGDRITGHGANTAEAVAMLEKRADAFLNAES